jgi:protein MpaA
MSFIHIPKWACTITGEFIPLFHSQKHLKDPILFIGGVHGDEPEGVRLAEELLAWLKSHTSPEELKPWALIPCLNPDGFLKNQRGNAKGVDLNRNYPSKNWTPYNDKDPIRYHPGPSAGSEPEIQALTQLINDIQPRIIIHFHSWKPCIVLTGEPARSEAVHLSSSSGYKIIENIGYDTPGGLSQYGWHDHKIPVICIEEQEHVDLNSVWPHFKEGLKKIICNKLQNHES